MIQKQIKKLVFLFTDSTSLIFTIIIWETLTKQITFTITTGMIPIGIEIGNGGGQFGGGDFSYFSQIHMLFIANITG